MTEKDFIDLVQHSNVSDITSSCKVDISKLKYFDLLEDLLWYTYNGSTRQNPFDYQNIVDYVEKPYYWDEKYDNQIKLVISLIFDIELKNIIDFSTNPSGLSTLISTLSSKKIDDSFLLFAKRNDDSILDSVIGHLRNGIAHGSFNRLTIENASHIAIYDRNLKGAFSCSLLAKHDLHLRERLATLKSVLNGDEDGFIDRVIQWNSNQELRHSANSLVKSCLVHIETAEDLRKYLFHSFCEINSPEDLLKAKYYKKYLYFINSSTVYKRNTEFAHEPGKDYTNVVKTMILKKLKKFQFKENDLERFFKNDFQVTVYKKDEFLDFVQM